MDVEIVSSPAQAPERVPSVPDASAGQTTLAQHPIPAVEPEPETTAHAHSEGVWMEESQRDPTPKLARRSPLRPATTQHPHGEFCEIAFWRGYVKASFYARVFDEDGEPVAIAQSPHFRPKGKEDPDATDQAVAAYEALRTQLEREGWEYAGDGPMWFATVFSRPQ